MKRLVLQHWHEAALPEIAKLSTANMRWHAAQMGADYRLLSGNVFEPRLSPWSQKLVMLLPEWDEYETVVMVDVDQFAVNGLKEDIFAETGYGWHHATAQARVRRNLKALTSDSAPFWGGAVYRLPLPLRVKLRNAYSYEEARPFDTMANGVDEGVMHRLAILAQIPTEGAYLNFKWCWPSYEEDFSKACFVHVRNRPTGSKLKNYEALRDAGIIQ